MHGLIEALGYLNLAAFLLLAVVGVRLWLRWRTATALWPMLAFADLAFISVVGRIAPTHPQGSFEHAVQRIDIGLLLLFPYLLYRFTTTFRRPTRAVETALQAMTVVLLVWTFALPSFPEQGDPRSTVFLAYLVGFLVHWSVLSSFGSWRLWRAGRGQPSIARRRMRFLAAASAGLTVALFLTAVSTSQDSPLQAASQLLAFSSAVAFLLGHSPPAILRVYWRIPEQRRVQDAVASLVALATTAQEIGERVLEPMAAIVGARGVEIRDRDGRRIAAHRRDGDGDDDDAETIEIAVPGGSLHVETTPYAPFFGEDELNLLRTMAALTGIALDRVRLFEQERESRLALERANEVMANFVTLAAHELRTPVTTIHGFVHTLNHLGDRLDPGQREEVSQTLEQQTQRMILLVEQLLDLSRLDAEAIDIAPQPLVVRSRLDELVATVAAARAEEVEVSVDGELVAELDPAAFDRIVSNLVANALRYGDTPVHVRAEQTDRHFRLTVEDRGEGVAPEFVPDLFERFTRSDAARARATGTGLGLAIARSYARAHGGDLVYEPAQPHGARFAVVLPTTRRRPAGR